MQKWEYWTGFLVADAKDEEVKKYLAEWFPDEWKPLDFSPEALMLVLNKRGKKGWELVSLTPVATRWGYKDFAGEIVFPGEYGVSTHLYLCVMKRPLPEPPPKS